jgi:hypothetical protein
MRCNHCGAEARPNSIVCEKCGTPLTSLGGGINLDFGSAMSDLGRDMARLQEDLNEQMRSTAASLRQGMTGWGAPLPPPLPMDFSAGLASSQGRGLVHAQEWAALVNPRPEQICQSANFVLSSPHVQSNPLYQSRVSAITFQPLLGDSELNAFATDHSVTLGDGREIQPPVIVFFGGLAVAVRLASAALAAHIRNAARGHANWSLAKTFQAMGQIVIQSGGLEAETAIEIFLRTVAPTISEGEERFVSLARSYAAAMEMFVVAHEAGHIALGHTLGSALNYDISCNQEREADSFGSSTLSSSPFREYLFLGQVFVTILFAWVDEAARTRAATTHPLSLERFRNAIESNAQPAREAANDFGLTVERLKELLPGGM